MTCSVYNFAEAEICMHACIVIRVHWNDSLYQWTHSSPLAWKIPWTEEPGGLQSMGSLRVGQDWATSCSLFTFMHWRRKWQPTPVFLPGESQGRGSLVGCPSMGLHRVGHDWSDLAAAAAEPRWLVANFNLVVLFSALKGSFRLFGFTLLSACSKISIRCFLNEGMNERLPFYGENYML